MNVILGIGEILPTEKKCADAIDNRPETSTGMA